MTARNESEQERLELVKREPAAHAQVKFERRFRELLEAAPDAILEIGGDGRVVLAHTLAGKMFGYSPAAVLGPPLGLLVSVYPRSRHQQHHPAAQVPPA